MNLSYKKKSIIKRFVALIMAVCCMFSMFPTVAGAVYGPNRMHLLQEQQHLAYGVIVHQHIPKVPVLLPNHLPVQ